MTPQQAEARDRDIRQAVVFALSEIGFKLKAAARLEDVDSLIQEEMETYLNIQREEA